MLRAGHRVTIDDLKRSPYGTGYCPNYDEYLKGQLGEEQELVSLLTLCRKSHPKKQNAQRLRKIMNNQLSNPAYRIETKRLVVRCYNLPARDARRVRTESVEHCAPGCPARGAQPWVKISGETVSRHVRSGASFVYGISNPRKQN
jgi:hypothetical protein